MAKAKSAARKPKIPAGGYAEVGTSGLKRWTGQIDEEFLPELRGPRGVKAYKEMRENSPIVGAMLFAIKWLARSAPWTIQSSDPNATTDTGDANPDERVDFIEQALFHDMSFTWQDILSDILTMLPFGWAYLEVVYKVRNGDAESDQPNAPASSKYTDGRIGWRKWALRSQDSLDRWSFDEAGGILGMVQQPPDKLERVFIPIEKALLFRTDVEKNNPEGKSILRNAHRAWYFVKNLENIEAIGIERDLAGYPYMKLLSDKDAPDVWNPNDAEMVTLLANLKAMVRAIKRDEQEGAVLPDWCELTLLSGSSRRSLDTNTVIQRHEQRIAMTVLADFIMIGHEQVGSKALFGGKAGLFALAMSGILKTIADTINRFAIPKLLKLNGMSTDFPPELQPGEVADVDLLALGEYISKLSGAGAVLFPNDALETHLLQLAKLPSQLPDSGIREAVVDTAIMNSKPQPEPGADEGFPDDDGDAE